MTVLGRVYVHALFGSDIGRRATDLHSCWLGRSVRVVVELEQIVVRADITRAEHENRCLRERVGRDLRSATGIYKPRKHTPEARRRARSFKARSVMLNFSKSSGCTLFAPP